MKAILVDDEVFAMDYLESLCNQIEDIEIQGKFSDSIEALEYVKNHKVDLVFLDIKMPKMNGIEMGQKLFTYNEDILIIYTTGYEQYALEAFQNRAIAYLLKPCGFKEVTDAVGRAKKLVKSKEKSIFIRTFGHFDIFVNGQPIIFKNAKAKELLALLVDRQGGIVTMTQAIDVLWENNSMDNSSKVLYRRAVSDMKRTLEEAAEQNIVIIGRAKCHIIPEAFDCDYYQFLNGDERCIAEFNHEYMINYSWSEFTLGKIENLLNKW